MNEPELKHPWYAIRVRSKFERVASASLSGKGYEEFLPLYHSVRPWSDRSKKLELPLFPGYLFCRFDVEGRLLPILTTPGVVSIVGAGRTPLSIPDREIEDLQTIIRSRLQAEPWPHLAAGARVMVETGPLAGIEGITLNVNKRHRLVVSIGLLQRSVAVELDRACVRPLLPCGPGYVSSGAGMPGAEKSAGF